MMYSGRGMYSLPETVTSRQTPSGLKPCHYLFRVRQTDRQSSEETVACRKVYGEQVEGVEKGDE